MEIGRQSEQPPTARDIRDAARDILPVFMAEIPIGFLFGTMSAAKGLSVAETVLMSVAVLAGSSQIAVMELWSNPLPIAAIMLSTALVNSRHLLMGASLASKLRHFGRLRRLAALFFLTDETWALGERRALATPVTPAYWFTLAVLIALAWIGSSFAGAALGPLLGDPKRLGADFAFTALFIALVAGFWRGFATLPTIVASAAASVLTFVAFGSPWHIASGAVVGVVVAYAFSSEDEAHDRR
jgi:4-azaleucine resistance transporter AzlC